MEAPQTPTKTRNDGINSLAKTLCTKWGLKLPIRDTPWSPSKIPHPDAIEEKVLGRIRFLYFKDRDALINAIEEFEEHAPYIYSEWMFKPRAELDVLPSLAPSESALRTESALRRDDVTRSERVTAELAENLLECLDQAAELVRLRVEFQKGAKADQLGSNIQNPIETGKVPPEAPHDQESDMIRNKKRQETAKSSWPSIRSFFPTVAPTRRQTQIVQGALESTFPPAHPLSDEFDASQDFLSHLGDVDMADIPDHAVNPDPDKTYNERSGDVSVCTTDEFCTPPTSPLLDTVEHSGMRAEPIAHYPNLDMADALYVQKPDSVRLPPPALPNRKRSLPESTLPSLSRKVFRGSETHQSARLYNVNALLPIRSEVSRSFDSNTSATHSFISTSTNPTTPSTSFTTETSGTSIPSSAASFETAPVPFARLLYRQDERPPLDRYEQGGNYGSTERMDVEEASLGRTTDPFNPVPPTLAHPAPRTSGVDVYLANLLSTGPFGSFNSSTFSTVSFREAYETVRVANHCKVPVKDVARDQGRKVEDYELFWSSLCSNLRKLGKVPPESSSKDAWNKAGDNFDGVALTGDLTFVEQRGSSVFDFRLKPMKMERLYRLARRFGSDRFFIVGMPGLAAENMPAFLKSEAATVRQGIIHWLVNVEHRFLGRVWRAFYVKPQPISETRKSSQSNFNEIKHRVYLFAVDGHGFRPRTNPTNPNRHEVMTVKDLLEWFMPTSMNLEQPCLKFFARLALGVSNTVATVQFLPREVIRSDDAFAEAPSVRRLNIKRSDEKKRGAKPLKPKSPVMNDGCARMSRSVAINIARELGLDHQVPCAFQGRIAGAKGVWMVDALDENPSRSDHAKWIEITDSQLKFEGHPIDALHPDPARMTFEVHSWAKRLNSARLNFQLMPILVDRGVPPKVFMRLLENDLTAKVAELEVAMDDRLSLRKWNQENNNVSEERARYEGIEMLGGLPNSTGEKINWFIEHGFESMTCRYLRDLLYKTIAHYCERLENKMNISIGRSTYALMIADPLAVLEENEIHIGFSSVFKDLQSGFQDTMLHNLDVLVARSPATLPSDVQKVRAVFKPELGVYKDVIIFSSKGKCSLADKLAGGDFDGDMAWICWEPSIVEPFENAEIPRAPGLKHYGITEDCTKMADIISNSEWPSQFLSLAFCFNMETNLLGQCSVYHESFCYRNGTIRDSMATDLAMLLGLLVDKAKGGLIFNEQTWMGFLKKHGLPARLPKPAYKNKATAKPTDHVIDKLVFVVAKGVRQKALGQFSQHFEEAVTYDDDLVRLSKDEHDESRGDPELKGILNDLTAKLQGVCDFWISNVGTEGEDEIAPKRGMTFRACVEHCRDMFLAIEPPDTSYPMIGRWKKAVVSGRKSHWLLLKASALFANFHSRNFVWHVAGEELGEMKAMRSRSYHTVTSDLFAAYKLNTKYIQRLEKKNLRSLEDRGDEDDEGWDDFTDAFADIDINE